MTEPIENFIASPDTFHTTHLCNIGDITAEVTLDTGFFRPSRLTYAPHMHIEWEIQIPYNGSYAVEICETGEEFLLSPGVMLLLPPGCYHNTSSREAPSDPVPEKFALRFLLKRNGVAEEAIYRSLIQAFSDINTPKLLPCLDVAPLLYAVNRELTTGKIGHLTMAQVQLCQFFVLFFRMLMDDSEHLAENVNDTAEDHPTIVRNSSLSRQEAIVQILDRCYHTPLTEASVAQMLGISVRGVSRLFADTFGMSFKQTLTQIRMRHAEKLIVRTDIPIEQIALRIGYESPSAFYAVFRRTYGMPPGVYRKSKKMQITKELSPDLGQNPTEDGVLKH